MSEIELSVAPPETVVDIFRNSVEISGWPIEKWTEEFHTKTVNEYCKGEEPLLLIFVDKDEDIQMLNRVPQNFDSREFIYMIKKPETVVTVLLNLVLPHVLHSGPKCVSKEVAVS